MAFSLPRSVVSSSRTNIPVASMARTGRSSHPPFMTPSLTTPSTSEPNVNTLSDEHLILTRKRHSDFDSHSIRINHRYAGQFLRWKEWNLKNQSMLKTKMIKTGDFLVAGPTPESEFPKIVHRSEPTSTNANVGELLDSQIFKIQLQESLHDFLTLQEDFSLGFRCKLVSVGDTVLPNSPYAPSKLFVKLYDDRFFPSPQASGHGSVWYKPGDRHASAEDCIRSELASYSAGHVARRWKCHGSFKFVLSRNGHWLNGLLWEDLGQ